MSSNPPHRETLPRRLGRYVLLSRLTEGGMTDVYAARLAEEVGPGRLLVIKILPDSVGDDPDAESRFLAEARMVLNLTHGNITTAFEFGRDKGGRPFLVMEYVPGPSLRRLLGAVQKRGEKLRISDALFIMGEVAKALGYAHSFSTGGDEKGIVHRDISPDNIIISTAGQVKLTDFGIAQFIKSRTFGPIFGKAAYIAPEVAAGETPTGASDIYSIGAVLYECISGKPPFKGADERETLRLVAQTDAPSLRAARPEVTEALEAFVFSLLEKNEANRPGSAAKMLLKLRGLLRSEERGYTESDLAETIHANFSAEDFMDPTPRESLKKALEGAGIPLTGEETTDELLDNRTVRLDELARYTSIPPKPPQRTAPKRRPPAWGLAAVSIALGVGWFVWGRGPEPATSHTVVDPPESTVGTDVPSDVAVAPIVEPAVDASDSASDKKDTDAAKAQTDAAPPEKPVTPKASKPTKRAAAVGGNDTDKPKAEKYEDAAVFGWLNINSYPWSYVTVDGKPLGGHTPHRRVKLKAGTHVLEFENPELGLTSKKTVQVTPWEETNIGVRLGP